MNDIDCKPRVFVIDSKGQVGVIHGRDGDTPRRIVVRYGSGGPYRFHSHLDLRPATRSEVEVAGLDGVSGRYL